MSEKPISPLRQRMIEDMSVRNFGEKTRNDYIRHVRTFTAFLGRSPDTATAEDLRRFRLHQSKTGVRPPTINGSVAALRFFFTVTLGRAKRGAAPYVGARAAQDAAGLESGERIFSNIIFV
jgi:site-specific recombinase XerD